MTRQKKIEIALEAFLIIATLIGLGSGPINFLAVRMIG
jgi:hypothetical protein